MPILTKAQAEAIYSAVCALNNVSANSGIELSFVSSTTDEESPMQRVTYAENAAGELVVFTGPAMARKIDRENYPNQAAFAAAYGLDGKQPRQAVYTPGIGWQVQDHLGRRGNYETEAQALEA